MNSKHQIDDKLREIYNLRVRLQNTDYQAIKFAEGEMTAEEYAPIKEQRAAWRKEINDLQAEIETLRAEEVAI